MFIRKYWIPLSMFILAIAGVGLYLLATQPPKDPIVIINTVEPIEKPTEQPTAEVVESETDTGGHFHADGTWHAEPHEVPAPVEMPITPLATPIAEKPTTATTDEPDLSFLDDPEAAIRRHAEILLDPDRSFPERHHAFWEHQTLGNKLRAGYYGKGEYRDALQKLRIELVSDPLLRMNGVDPERLRASVPRKHDPSYIPAPPIVIRASEDTIRRAREALKEGGDTQ